MRRCAVPDEAGREQDVVLDAQGRQQVEGLEDEAHGAGADPGHVPGTDGAQILLTLLVLPALYARWVPGDEAVAGL